MVDTVTITRGIKMVPVYNVPIDNIGTIIYCNNNRRISHIQFNDELNTWLAQHNLPDDNYSNLWRFLWFEEPMIGNFFFADPKIAMLFKLTWT